MNANHRPCGSGNCFISPAAFNNNNNNNNEPVGIMDNISQYNKFPQMDEENILAGTDYENTTGQQLPMSIPEQSQGHVFDDYYKKFSDSNFGQGLDGVGDNILEYGKGGFTYVKDLFNDLRRNILIRNVCIIVIIFLILLLIVVR